MAGEASRLVRRRRRGKGDATVGSLGGAAMRDGRSARRPHWNEARCFMRRQLPVSVFLVRWSRIVDKSARKSSQRPTPTPQSTGQLTRCAASRRPNGAGMICAQASGGQQPISEQQVGDLRVRCRGPQAKVASFADRLGR